MYHISHTISDEYNKREHFVTSRDETTKINVMTAKCSRVFSGERMEKQNKSIIWSSKAHYKDYIQEDGSTFLKDESKESFDPSKLKMQTKITNLNKPLTTSKDTSHYSEFVTKLDYLVGKVIELAQSSGDVSVKNSEVTQNVMGNTSSSSVKSKTLPQKRNSDSGNITCENIAETFSGNGRSEEPFIPKQYSNCLHFGQSHIHKLADAKPTDKGEIPKLDQHLTYRMAINTGSLMGATVPPILNDSIKYIRVNSKDLNENENSIGSLKRDAEPIMCEKQASINAIRNRENDGCKFGGHLLHDVISESLKCNSYIHPITVNGAELETYRILISGHLTTTRETPVFIVHKNYIKSSTLIKGSLDFRAHKKQGNVDISLAGKFFHDNILIENDKGYPAALDLKSHRLLIDRRSAVTQESFKQIFNLGLFDAILEGEFVANNETLQYIPIFSLEVVKHKPSVEVNIGRAATAIEIDDQNVIDSSRGNTKESVTDEIENTNVLQCPQKSTQEDNLVYDSNKDIKRKKIKIKPKESKFTKFKENIFLKLFYFKNKGNNSNDSENAQSSQNTSGVTKSSKNEKRPKKIEETKLEEEKKPRKFALEISEVNSSNDSCLSPRKVHIEEKGIEKKSTKKKHSKRSKIVENPGVAQMQGFFFQT